MDERVHEASFGVNDVFPYCSRCSTTLNEHVLCIYSVLSFQVTWPTSSCTSGAAPDSVNNSDPELVQAYALSSHTYFKDRIVDALFTRCVTVSYMLACERPTRTTYVWHIMIMIRCWARSLEHSFSRCYISSKVKGVFRSFVPYLAEILTLPAPSVAASLPPQVLFE
jgi:hypothetical protein